MEPHNSNERNRAFRNFLLFFTITIALVITAVFSSMQVPFKENEKLDAESKVAEHQNSFTQRFADITGSTMLLLDSVNLVNVKSDKIEQNIADSIAAMRAMINGDSSIAERSLYINISHNLEDLKVARKLIREGSGVTSNLEKLQQENARLHSDLIQANNNYNSCQIALSAYMRRQ